MTLKLQTLESRLDLSPSKADGKLRILIPYDGSERSVTALNDLKRAGLPAHLDTLVTVTPVWLPMSPSEITRVVSARRMKALTAGISSFVPALRAIEEQQVLSTEAERRIRSIFPSATVRAEAIRDVAVVTNEILQKGEEWNADLIVVGANTSPSSDITDYAGPALKVAEDAHCSVRIARVSNRSVRSPVRIVIGFDGSNYSKQVVRTVADRYWLPGSHVRLVTVHKIGLRDFTKDSEITMTLTQLAEELRAAGLEVSTTVGEGELHNVLLNEAREFSADCIFVHARGPGKKFNGTSHRALNDVARAVVLGAHCSVEVVRENDGYDIDVKPAA